MTTAALFKHNTIEEFNRFVPSVIMPEGRPVITNYEFDASPVDYSAMGQGVFVRSANSDALIAQAKNLCKRHIWRFWGLRAPVRSVIDAAVSVIRFCPSELLLDGYRIENYGNGTVVLSKRSPSYMITINIGKSTLSYAKLRIPDHMVVFSGKCDITKDEVTKLFESL